MISYLKEEISNSTDLYWFKSSNKYVVVDKKFSELLSLKLKSIVQQLYSDIRSGMKNLTLEDIKEILRIEVRKSILYSHQVSEESNKHSERGVHKSIGHVLDLETNLKQKVDSNLGQYSVPHK